MVLGRNENLQSETDEPYSSIEGAFIIFKIYVDFSLLLLESGKKMSVKNENRFSE